MRLIHAYILPLTILAVMLLSVSAVCAKEPVELNWALLHDTEKGLQSLDFSTVPVIPRGSTLQLYLHPGKHTYTYVFLVDSSKQVIPLFPSSLDYYDDNLPDEEIHIPAGQNRFTIVPPPGEEKFYLLASSTRLKTLERYMEECLVKPKDTNLQARLYREIRVLRRTHSSFSQFTEKGMPVSGTTRQLEGTRGVAQKTDFQITQITANGFYSRILRLKHD